MRKIPTLYMRDERRHCVLPIVNPSCQWVIDGEGVATRKLDGTCCLIRDGKLFKRRELREGDERPEDFETIEHDEITGKTFGWVPVGDGPDDRWHREAFDRLPPGLYEGRTLELLGPKVQGNPEGFPQHRLIPHGEAPLGEPPRDFEGLRAWLAGKDIEGIVWHHPDGRRAKIKGRDFGLKRGPVPETAPGRVIGEQRPDGTYPADVADRKLNEALERSREP